MSVPRHNGLAVMKTVEEAPQTPASVPFQTRFADGVAQNSPPLYEQGHVVAGAADYEVDGADVGIRASNDSALSQRNKNSRSSPPPPPPRENIAIPSAAWLQLIAPKADKGRVKIDEDTPRDRSGASLQIGQRVRFRKSEKRRGAARVGYKCWSCFGGCVNLIARWLRIIESTWLEYGRPMVVCSSLFELWSMGIWLGFVGEPAMGPALLRIVLVDMACNVLYLLDVVFIAIQDRREYISAWQDDKAFREKGEKQAAGGIKDMPAMPARGPSTPSGVDGPARWHWFGWLGPRLLLKMIMAFGMVPIQFWLYSWLTGSYAPFWEIALMLLFRLIRLVWAFSDCAGLLNRQELEVYVDIRMHGTASAASWNRAIILVKQFLIVAFFGHWFGCLAYAIRQTGSTVQNDIRIRPDNTRDYFTKFGEDAAVSPQAEGSFGVTYLLAIYRGFNINLEELLPERPIDLAWELVGSMLILLMKSYCIGSFFKYHQKLECEVQRFSKLMVCVSQYLDLYEVPPSLRKAVISHFRFQQANHRKKKTLEVIGQLPVEVQKKLREHEVLPTVVDRNPLIFGNGLLRDFCLQIAVGLSTHFLQPGDIIFLETEVPRELVFLVAGAVACSRFGTSAEGQRTEALMRYIRADRSIDPTLLGGVALILGCPHFHSARVRAGAEAVTLNMPRAQFEDILAAFPGQHDLLIRNVAEAHLLDKNGDRVAEHENESFMALQEDVRLTLQARQDGMNAMFTYAASKGDERIVKDLLGKRVDANVNDYDGCSALQVAASEGMADVIELLLDAGGDANARDRWSRTPMQEALNRGNIGAAMVLRKHGGKLELADPAGTLCTHASQGDTAAMQQLLDFGLDPNTGDYDARTALHVSASEGHLPVVLFLTSRKADVNAKDRWGSTPIQDAIRRGDLSMVQHLRSCGGQMDNKFLANQLCDAASTGDLPMLELLTKTGVDVDQGDYDARTALHLAAAEGQVLAVSFLVNTVLASSSPVDRWGATPLQDALAAGNKLCAQMLLTAGARLGPSADQETYEAAAKVAREIGLTDPGIFTFADRAQKLRKRLRLHMTRVQQGKARSDIFGIEEAQRFGHKVISASFRRLSELKQEAQWFITLLKKLEPAAEATWQLVTLLKDSMELMSEAKLWHEVFTLELAKRAKKAAPRGNRKKDAPEMAFHTAFISSTRFVPALLTVLEGAAGRVLGRVADLQQAPLPTRPIQSYAMLCPRPAPDVQEGAFAAHHRRASTFRLRPCIGELVVEELLKELGWTQEDCTPEDMIRNVNNDSGAKSGANGSYDDDSDPMANITQKHLVWRLEEQAKILLPADHACRSLLDGALHLLGSGAEVPGEDPNPATYHHNPALEDMRKWLRQHSRELLAGEITSADPPPKLPTAARPEDAFGSLCSDDPHQEWRHKLQSVAARRSLQSPTALHGFLHGEDSLELPQAMSVLVASELVLLSLTTLVIEGWDIGSRLPEIEQRALTGSRQRHGASMARRLAKQGQAVLTHEDFMELGLIFREAARVCRGTPQEAKKLWKRRKRMRKDAEAEEVTTAVLQADALTGDGHDDEEGAAAANPSPPGPNVDKDPIRVAKLLALQDKMSLDELAVLVDMDDNPKPTVGSRGTGAMGEISRERFVRNLLRIILDYDDMQNDVMEAVREKHRAEEAVLEARVVDRLDRPFRAKPYGIQAINSNASSRRSITSLYDELDRLHEILEMGVGPQSNCGDEVEPFEVGWAPSLNNMKKMDSLAMRKCASTGSRTNDYPELEHLREQQHHMHMRASVARIVEQNTPQPQNNHHQVIHHTHTKDLDGHAIEARCLNFLVSIRQLCGPEGRKRRRQRRIAKRFKELDDDGDGVGPAETAQLLAVAFQHGLGAEEELRWSYRLFELLNKADVGDLVTLPEVLEVLPKLEEEIKHQQYSNRRGHTTTGSSDAPAIGPVARFASGMVIPPESPFLHAWDALRAIVVIYYMLEVPVRFTFLSFDHMDGWPAEVHVILNACADAFMVFNVLLTFFRAVVHPALGVVTTFPEIRMHYLLGLFAVDAVACNPVDWWMHPLEGEEGFWARPQAALRLIKLLHMHHLRKKETHNVEASHGFNRAAVSAVLGITSLAHFLACSWWLIGTRYSHYDPSQVYSHEVYSGGEDHARRVEETAHASRGSWTSTYTYRPGESYLGDFDGQTPFWWQYLISFYWTLGQITHHNSHGKLHAASWVELAWVCALHVLNVAVNGYWDGILVDKVIAGDEQAIEAKAMRNIVNEYLEMAKLPPELVKEVQGAAQHFDKMVERQGLEDTIAAVPYSFKQRVARRTVVPRLASTEVFAGCSSSFLVEIGAHCRIVTVAKDEPLSHPGETASQLAVLNSGRICVVDAQGYQLAETNESGEIIGELPFIFNLKHCVLITTLEESRLTVLPGKDFARACRMYPEDSQNLRRNALRRIKTMYDSFGDNEGKSQLGGKRFPGSHFASGTSDKGGNGGNAGKSVVSYMSSSSWSSNAHGPRIGVKELLMRLYARELSLVAEKLQEEDVQRREATVSKFIREAAEGNVAKVTAMLGTGEVLPDEGDYNKRTALHLAVCNGHMEVVKVLLEQYNASVNVKDRFGHTPAQDAVREKQVPILHYLQQHGAVYQADVDVAVLLCQAASSNDIASIRVLLEEVGMDANAADYDKRTALHLGASEGHMAVVELLMKIPGTNISPVDRWGNTPLDDAMRHNHWQVRKLLCSRGAKMGERNLGVVLCTLAAANNIDGLRELADVGVDLGQGDYDARTALHLAASENRAPVATYLLIEAKVNPNAPDRFLGTALDDAIRHKHKAMEALLRENGALRGSDPAMVPAISRFHQERKSTLAELEKAKMDKEVENSEVSTIIAKLKHFKRHATLEDDVHLYVALASNVRDLILRLINWSTLPPPPEVADNDDLRNNGNGTGYDHPTLTHGEQQPQQDLYLTKSYREQLLDKSIGDIDEAVERMIAVLDGEVLPWLTGLSHAESKVLKCLVPELRPTVTRVLHSLRDMGRLAKVMERLWVERGPGGGAFQSLPVGLLVQRAMNRATKPALSARVEAEVLLWATGRSSGQATTDTASSSKGEQLTPVRHKI